MVACALGYVCVVKIRSLERLTDPRYSNRRDVGPRDAEREMPCDGPIHVLHDERTVACQGRHWEPAWCYCDLLSFSCNPHMLVTHENSAVVSCMHFRFSALTPQSTSQSISREPPFTGTASVVATLLRESTQTFTERTDRSCFVGRLVTSFLQLSFKFHLHPWSMPLFSTSTTALLVNSTPLLRLQCEHNKEPGTVCLTCSPTPNNWRSSWLHIARTRRTQPQQCVLEAFAALSEYRSWC